MKCTSRFVRLLLGVSVALVAAGAMADVYLQRLESLQVASPGGIYFDTGCKTSLDDWEYVLDAHISGDWSGANGRMQFKPYSKDSLRHVYHVRTTASGEESVSVEDEVYSNNPWGSQYCDTDILIFALGGYNGCYQYGTIWSFQLLKNGDVVRDMFPVLSRMAGDTPIYGLYDKVSGRVFEQQGSGTIIPGAVVTEGELGFSVFSLVAQADTSVLCTWRIGGADVGFNAVDVGVAWGYDAEALVHTNVLCEACALQVTTNALLFGVPPQSTVYMQLLAVDAGQVVADTEVVEVSTLAAPADETYDFGSRAISSVEIVGNQARLVFAPAATGGPHRLYALFGKTPGGSVRSAWEHVAQVAEIADGVTEYVYNLPAGWGRDVFALRFAFDLMEEQDVPYDSILEYIASDGQNRQFIDTGLPGGCTTDGGLEFSADMMWLNVPNDGCFLGSYDNDIRCYLVYSYPMRWNLGFGGNNCNDGYSPAANVRYLVEGVFHGGEQRVVVNGSPVVERSFAGPISALNLYVFALNYGGRVESWTATRLYSLVLSENGVRRRDFVPCEKDGVGMLYDRVTHQLYQNQMADTQFVKSGQTYGKVQFVPFSPTCYHRDLSLPLFEGASKTDDDGTWATIAGRLVSFGGARENCKVRLYFGTENNLNALTQYGEALTPQEDGSFEFRVESLNLGTEYFWTVEAEGESGGAVRLPTAGFITRLDSQLADVTCLVNHSTLSVSGSLIKRGVGPATVILRVGTSAANAEEKARQEIVSEPSMFAFTWAGYQDGCDWDVPQYWEVLVVNSAGGESWTNVYGRTSVGLQDSTVYLWTGNGVADADGLYNWRDVANWQPKGTALEDRAGYPTVGASAEFSAESVAKIRLDRMHSLSQFVLGERGQVSLVGNASGVGLNTRMTLSAGVCLTLDEGVKLETSSAVSPAGGGKISLDHGSELKCFRLDLSPGENVYGGEFAGSVCAYGGSRLTPGECWLGDEGEIYLDNSTIVSTFYFDAMTGGGKLTIAGTNSVVDARTCFRGWNDPKVTNPGRGVVEFIIPEGGYVSTPIQSNCVIGGTAESVDSYPLNFCVNRKSPVRYMAGNMMSVLLVNALAINPDRLVLSDYGVAKANWRYDPDSTSPTQLYYDVPRASGLTILFR